MSLIDALLLEPYFPLNYYLADREDGVGGTGTLNDPWHASTADRFDQIMRDKIPPFAHIHIGPGTFSTKGYYDGAASDYGWRVKLGWKITGAGIDATKLQIVGANASDVHYFAVGHALASICSAIFLFGCFSSPAAFIFSPDGGVLDFQSGIPFFTQSSQTPGVRYQQIYGSGDFLSHGTSQYLITELAFGVSGGDLVTLSNVQINLSTSAKVPDGLSSTFGENVGPDDAVVYSGRLPVDGVGTSFNFHIPLQHPFLYDPAAGSLLLDVRNFQTIRPTLDFSLMDGANSSLDRISSAASFNVNSPTANLFVNTSGLATLFTVTPVPEPSAVLMIALGLVAFVGWRFGVPLMKSNIRNKRSGS